MHQGVGHVMEVGQHSAEQAGCVTEGEGHRPAHIHLQHVSPCLRTPHPCAAAGGSQPVVLWWWGTCIHPALRPLSSAAFVAQCCTRAVPNPLRLRWGLLAGGRWVGPKVLPASFVLVQQWGASG